MTSNWSPQFLQYIDCIDEKDICTKHKINHLASRLNNHRWSLPAISIPFIMMAPSTALSFFTLQLHRPSLPHSPLYVCVLISLSHAQEFSSDQNVIAISYSNISQCFMSSFKVQIVRYFTGDPQNQGPCDHYMTSIQASACHKVGVP